LPLSFHLTEALSGEGASKAFYNCSYLPAPLKPRHKNENSAALTRPAKPGWKSRLCRAVSASLPRDRRSSRFGGGGGGQGGRPGPVAADATGPMYTPGRPEFAPPKRAALGGRRGRGQKGKSRIGRLSCMEGGPGVGVGAGRKGVGAGAGPAVAGLSSGGGG